ncbi:hypothetical protein GF336_01755 [Candidatus Woesearchaeota archaeon]|nr:hypothetical protein [Candidatus Woesearchaeota archaeon]
MKKKIILGILMMFLIVGSMVVYGDTKMIRVDGKTFFYDSEKLSANKDNSITELYLDDNLQSKANSWITKDQEEISRQPEKGETKSTATFPSFDEGSSIEKYKESDSDANKNRREASTTETDAIPSKDEYNKLRQTSKDYYGSYKNYRASFESKKLEQGETSDWRVLDDVGRGRFTAVVNGKTTEIEADNSQEAGEYITKLKNNYESAPPEVQQELGKDFKVENDNELVKTNKAGEEITRWDGTTLTTTDTREVSVKDEDGKTKKVKQTTTKTKTFEDDKVSSTTTKVKRDENLVSEITTSDMDDENGQPREHKEVKKYDSEGEFILEDSHSSVYNPVTNEPVRVAIFDEGGNVVAYADYAGDDVKLRHEDGELYTGVLPSYQEEQYDEHRLDHAKWQSRQAFEAADYVLDNARGMGYLSSLFFKDEFLADWREAVNKAFCDTFLFGGLECWQSKICGNWYDKTAGSTAFARVGARAVPAANIEGTRSAAITTPQGTQYFYRITFGINAVTENVAYDVQLKTASGSTRSILTSTGVVEQGKTYSKKGASGIYQYSSTYYTEVCLNVISGDFDGYCQPLAESDYGAGVTPQPAAAGTEEAAQPAQPPGQSTDPGVSDF